jgi:hypothetical protein
MCKTSRQLPFVHQGMLCFVHCTAGGSDPKTSDPCVYQWDGMLEDLKCKVNRWSSMGMHRAYSAVGNQLCNLCGGQTCLFARSRISVGQFGKICRGGEGQGLGVFL